MNLKSIPDGKRLLSALGFPRTDPSPIFELCRGNFATELLAAGVVHFQVFRHLASNDLTFGELCTKMGLAQRPAHVLLTALSAFGLIRRNRQQMFRLTPMAREHLTAGSLFDVSDYIALNGTSPGVAALAERLQSNRPAGAKEKGAGAAFIYRSGIESAMENEAKARALTLALAGRAKNVAPFLAKAVPLGKARLLLDVGGGTGIYSIALLQKNPGLRAIVLDRPEVLKVAAEMAEAYGVGARLELLAGDMFTDPWPEADTILLSNILHDWDAPQCQALIQRCAASLPSRTRTRPGGRLCIHDVFLNDALDGPLPIALYSAALFSLTEGRAYSAAEYRAWLREAGLRVRSVRPTFIHCGVIMAGRR